MAKKVTIKRPGTASSRDNKDADQWVNSREENKSLTFHIPASLHSKLKIYSVKTDKTMGEIVNELLEEKLK